MTESAHVNKLNPRFDSWEAAYLALRSLLISTALRLTNGNMANAEDLLQATFYRAIKACPSVEMLEYPLRYLRVTLSHTWMKKNARVEIELDEVSPNNSSLIMQPEIQQILERKQVLDTLSEAGFLKQVDKQLLKAVRSGFTLDEIAEARGESAELTRARWYRIVAKLRYHFGDKEV